MVNDPIGDMLVQIRNATLAKKDTIELPYSKLKKALGEVLVKEGYIGAVSKVGEDPKARLRISMKYVDGQSVITGVTRISKPGLRRYVDTQSIPTVVGGMGIAVLSTPMGLLTGKDAKKKHTGGELLCKVW